MSENQHRQPAGVPTGGQFAASAKAESGVSLDASKPASEMTGYEMLAVVHAQHATRIADHNAAMREGAIVTIEVTGLTDTSPFYTGVRSGDRVRVVHYRALAGRESRAVQILDAPAASLSVNDAHTLTPVDPGEWTRQDALAAQETAEQAATGALERAYASANGLLGAPAGDEAALAALRTAHDLRDYAFACGVYAKALDPTDRGYWVRMAHEKRNP